MDRFPPDEECHIPKTAHLEIPPQSQRLKDISRLVEDRARDGSATAGRALRTIRRAQLCGTTRTYVRRGCGATQLIKLTCKAGKLCPSCADTEARRQFAVTMERMEQAPPGSRVWFLTVTDPTDIRECGPGEAARARARFLKSWQRFRAWLRALRQDIIVADLFLQVGPEHEDDPERGGKLHGHAMIVTTEKTPIYRTQMIARYGKKKGQTIQVKPYAVLANTENLRFAWLVATDGRADVVRVDNCSRPRKGQKQRGGWRSGQRMGGKKGAGVRSAARYASRYAGRPWGDNLSVETLAVLAIDWYYKHTTWRSRQLGRPAYTPQCPACDTPAGNGEGECPGWLITRDKEAWEHVGPLIREAINAGEPLPEVLWLPPRSGPPEPIAPEWHSCRSCGTLFWSRTYHAECISCRPLTS